MVQKSQKSWFCTIIALFLFLYLIIYFTNIQVTSFPNTLFSPNENSYHFTQGIIEENVSTAKSKNNSQSLLKKLKSQLESCPKVPLELEGTINISTQPVRSFEVLKKMLPLSGLDKTGHYKPPKCQERCTVAIIIPYRDRFNNLTVLFRNLHPLLQKQQVGYTIYVMEQFGKGNFNRAKLFNVGYVEAMKRYNYDCFIFHDVDLIPENDLNIYNCPELPRHMSSAVDIFNYKLPYSRIFGGVCAISAEHFKEINGFSNMFWGWGGEDDDMSMRIRAHSLRITRYPPRIGRYRMLAHRKQKASSRRFRTLSSAFLRMKKDGLSNLKYRKLQDMALTLCTWIVVDLLETNKI